MRGGFWILLMSTLLVLSLVGEVRWRPGRSAAVQAHLETGKSSYRRLFVLVHGYTPREARLDQTSTILKQYGDVLRIEYPAALYSSKEPEDICGEINELLEKHVQTGQYESVVLVAHSVGALLARRTLLDGQDSAKKWVSKVRRVVLLAGANRGWSLDGDKPADLGTATRFAWRIAEWGARLTGFGTFILQFQKGTPFVANLRLDWMRRMNGSVDAVPLEVVQMLGDIDDIVSADDSEDLRVMASKKYALIRVRGTGHGDIIDFADAELGQYRERKLILAATAPFEAVWAQNEEQPFTTDSTVTSVVFVLHGIRDLGRWSSEFETEIRSQIGGHVIIVSPRYGYLGMGPFLLPSVRSRFVRWFMDQYTETLARYPSVSPDNIHFFGHSNGTFLLAAGLEEYGSMKINRVVFAGSVVPKNYDWDKRIQDHQVQSVRNYVGTEDWVVALFPRLFELRPALWLKNPLGSAGFNGFDDGGACGSEVTVRSKNVSNVCFVKGEHGAFEGRVTEIVQFLLSDHPPAAKLDQRPLAGKVLAYRATVWLVWLLIVGAIAYIGIRVVSAAPSPSWVVLVLFILVVIRTLQTV